MKLKKFWAIGLSAAMALSMAACGSSTADTATTSSGAETSSASEKSSVSTASTSSKTSGKSTSSASASGSAIAYKDITLGTTGTDITADLKMLTNRTDMLKDDYTGTSWAKYLEEFNKVYPNIKINIEVENY